MQRPASALFRFNRERQEIIEQVVERVTREAIRQAWQSPEDALEYRLHEAAFAELSRLDRGDTSRFGPDFQFWRDVAHRVGRAGEEENAELLNRIVVRYARDIAGHFRANVFRLATSVLPSSISLVFGKQQVSDLLTLQPNLTALQQKVQIEGETGKLRQLSEIGTLMMVPTHSSHMDSMLMGWALNEVKLPPVTYGAETNLFSNPMTSFFMQNLGAYKVDRTQKHALYKTVLKEYSRVLIERGFHSLFFPGGHRSRNNQVESHLKLGLLGTALDAYTSNVMARRSNPNVFIVPVTMNYNLVLEAETLIHEHLEYGERGRAIIEDDEFTDFRRVVNYMGTVLEMDSPLSIRFGTPMDVFGNQVDIDGESIDLQGRRVDPERYLWIDGAPGADRDRDRQYTRLLGDRITESFRSNTVIQPLHLVSFAVFEHLRRQHPGWDLQKVLRFSRGEKIGLTIAEGETERLVRLVRRDAEEGIVRLSRSARTMSARQMVDEAIRYWRAYHTRPIATVELSEIRLGAVDLLHFYANRLAGYDLERRLRTPGGYR